VHFDIGLGVNGVRETSKLGYPAEIRYKIFVNLPGTGSLADIFEFLVVD
jgi:hypothetical protein